MFATLNDKEKYNLGFNKLTQSEIWILCEGDSNVLFYQNYPEINKIPIRNGFCCSSIIESVESNKNRYGIIDNDYRLDFEMERVYSIDFYSIENLMLLYWYSISELRILIESKIDEVGFENFLLAEVKQNIKCDEKNKPEEFQIVLTNKMRQRDHIEYLSIKVNNKKEIYKYKKFKDIVLKFFYYIKCKYGKTKDTQYSYQELFYYLPSKDLSFLFKTKDYDRLKFDLQIN